MHVGFLLLLGFALIANLKAQDAGRAWRWFWALGVARLRHRPLQLGRSTPTLIRAPAAS